MALMMRNTTTTMSSASTSRTAAAGRRPAAAALAPRRAAARRVATVRAAAASEDGVVQVATSIGLPTDEGLFGFKPFAERWTGRLAMMGFVTSIVEEAMGNGGTLAQVGLPAGPGTLAALAALLGGATLVGTVATAARLVRRQMTPQEMARYRSFLGLNDSQDFIKAAADMKAKGDWTSLRTDAAAVAAARAGAMPADRVLGVGPATVEAQAAAEAAQIKAADGSVLTLTKAEEAAQVAAAAAEARQQPAAAGPSVSLAARGDVVEQDMFSSSSEMRYARQVELDNGRWAMVGFAAALLGEAATGHGILGQLIDWFKLSGLLGAASGF